ncbi:MAG TPA: polysaccharide pyruvyl transferase family protein [Solirubrobacteraceae bacterium]
MRLAHFGTFDVENYGDLLFPLVVARRLEGLATEIVHVSPVGGPPVWDDCVATVAPSGLDPETLDAVLVGGGNIVHAGPAGVPDYREDGLTWLLAYAGLWTEPARLAARHGIPVAWNAPGVPQPFSPRVAEVVRWAAAQSALLTVRDRHSLRRLRDAGVEEPVGVVPDTAFDVADLFTAAELDEAYARAFADRGRERPDRALAVHVNERDLGDDAAATAGVIDRLAADLDAVPVLVALGRCHGDAAVAHDVASRLEADHVVVDRLTSLREAVAILARSDAYAGSSLHGLVTALAFGRPAVAVAREQDEGRGHFSGLLQPFRLEERLVADWGATTPDLLRPHRDAAALARVAPTARAALDAHWARVTEALQAPRRKPAKDPVPPPALLLEHAVDGLADLFDRERRRHHAARERARRHEERARELEAEAGDAEVLRSELATLAAETTRRGAEVERLQKAMAAHDDEVEALERGHREQLEARLEAEAALTNERAARAEAERTLAAAEAVRADLDRSLRETRAQRAELEWTLRDTEAARDEAVARVAAAEETLRNAREEGSAHRLRARELESAVALGERRLADAEARVAALARARQELGDRELVIERAKGAVVGLEDAAQRVAGSRAWRFGHGVMRTLRVLTFRPPKGLGAAELLTRRAREASEALSLAPVGAPPPPPPVDAGAPETAPSRDALAVIGELGGDAALAPPRDAAGVLRAAPADDPESVDVVVCVHDAPDDVHRCFDALLERTGRPFRLIVVDDGSDEETATYLDRFVDANPAVELRRNADPPHGYTIAANIGLRASTAAYVVLLNSDTVVTRGWLDELVAVGRADESVGIIGPLSNAATHQSVPLVRENGEWFVNPVPEWLTEDGIALVLRHLPGSRDVAVPFLNGFCYCVRRRTIDAVGLFDEDTFGAGYSEENDYSRRAAEAGFGLRVATRAYVFHAKSRSYGHAGRRELAKRHYATFLSRYGEDAIRGLVAEIEGDTSLAAVRARVAEALEDPVRTVGRLPKLSVAYVLPGLSRGGSGGTHSIYQEADALRSLGIEARVLVPSASYKNAEWAYPAAGDLFATYDDEAGLARRVDGHDVVVATHFKSVPAVARLAAERPSVITAYYVQDYEPLFQPPGSDAAIDAERSYGLIPGAVLFAKTDWLRATVSGRTGVPVAKVVPSLDHEIFNPDGRRAGRGPVHVVAMVRPRTPRRAPQETFQVLARLAAEHGDRVRVTTFGCDDGEVQPPPGVAHAGLLSRPQVANLLRDADVFLDCSWYQAFGRTGLEAMACGATAVLPRIGGVREFARDGVNCLLADTWDLDATYATVATLVEQPELLRRLQEQALATPARFTPTRAALSAYALFCHEHDRRAARAADGAEAAPRTR